MPKKQQPRPLPAVVRLLPLALVFVLKLIVVLQLHDHILLQPHAGLDTTIYHGLAERVRSGDLALGPGLYFISPLYIYFLAAVLAAGGSTLTARIVQVALGTAAVWLIWWMAREWFGRRAARVAGALAALTGLFTFYETLLLQAALDPFLTAAALSALTRALTRGGSRWFVVAGLAFGVQAMNRPNVLVAAVAVVVLSGFGGRVAVHSGLARSALARPAALLAGILIALLPLTIRNALVAGDWSPLSSHGGLNFYIGNNPEADGTYHMVPGITPNIAGQQDDARRVAQQAVGRPLDDAEVSAYFYGRGVEWIRRDPDAAARLFARKLAYVFNAAHLSLNFSYPFYARDTGTLLAALVVGPWLLIPLGLFGLGAAAWQRRDAGFLLWAAFVPLYAVAVALFFVSERYRLPLLVPLCVGAGAAADVFAGALVERRGRRLAGAIAAVAVLAAAANWRFGLDSGRAEERTRMAERLIHAGRYAEAERWASRAVEIAAQPAVTHFRIGRALQREKQPDAALGHLEQASRLDPQQAEVSYAYGQALVDAGRPHDAVPYLRRAVEAGVRADVAGFDLVRALAAIGDRDAAVAALEQVKPANAADATSWYALAEMAATLKAPGLAEAFLREAVRARPGFVLAHRQLGAILAMRGRFAEAARALEEAVRLEPRDPAAHLNLAVAYAELGRLDAARTHAREALRLDPTYDKARQLLGALK